MEGGGEDDGADSNSDGEERMVSRGSSTLIAIGCVAVLGLWGCQPEGAGEGEEAAPEAAAVQPPDTTGAGLWAHLQSADYRESWQMWPGTGQLYEGQEPHGMLLTTYVNSLAHDAITNKAGAMSDGAIVVKENYAPDSTLAAVTVMYKAEGYNPDVGNWYWVKYLPDGSVDSDGMAQGRVQGCIACHGGKADNDYIMTASLR